MESSAAHLGRGRSLISRKSTMRWLHRLVATDRAAAQRSRDRAQKKWQAAKQCGVSCWRRLARGAEITTAIKPLAKRVLPFEIDTWHTWHRSNLSIPDFPTQLIRVQPPYSHAFNFRSSLIPPRWRRSCGNTISLMDPFILKTLHVAGAFGLFASLGATLLAGSGKKSASILHGVSLLLIFLVGFAMLKKPPMGESWWMIKIGLWLFIGLAPVLAKRKVLPPYVVLILCIVAAVAAAWLGLRKPF